MDRNFTIYRYEIPLSSQLLKGDICHTLEVPRGSRLIASGITKWRQQPYPVEDTKISVWFMVDTTETGTECVDFMVLGTGFAELTESVTQSLEFVNTVTYDEAQEVYHVFRLVPRTRTCSCACARERAA